MGNPSPMSSGKEKLPSPLPAPAHGQDRCPSWIDEACVQDLDRFAKTLTGIKAKGVRSEILGSILSHYASRWLPELSGRAAADPAPESPTAAWLKKRFFVETLVSVLPAEKGAVPCDFLLRLLRTASMVGANAACARQLEARAGAQLDEASLKELMIPGFSHTCGTLLDVGLVLRLVRRFAGGGGGAADVDGCGAVAAPRSAAALARVAKLVDSYLAEAALDAGLTVGEFEELASALPVHARAIDDGLYRAIDTFIKAHPSASKQERKSLCRLIDARKLSSEAALHAAQNERLPVRSVIQVLFSENAKLNHLATADWSGSFSWGRSPSPALEPPGRCSSKREVLAQQQEVRRLRDDVARLQVHCHALQAQIDRLGGTGAAAAEKKKRGFFRWRSFLFRSSNTTTAASETAVEKLEEFKASTERGRPTPAYAEKKGRLPHSRSTTPTKWRNSLS